MTLNDLMNVDLNPLAHPAVTDTLQSEALWVGIGIAVVFTIAGLVAGGAYELWDAPRAKIRHDVSWARISIENLRKAAHPLDGWPPRHGAVEEFTKAHALLMKHDRAYRKAQVATAQPKAPTARIEPTLTRKGH